MSSKRGFVDRLKQPHLWEQCWIEVSDRSISFHNVDSTKRKGSKKGSLSLSRFSYIVESPPVSVVDPFDNTSSGSGAWVASLLGSGSPSSSTIRSESKYKHSFTIKNMIVDTDLSSIDMMLSVEFIEDKQEWIDAIRAVCLNDVFRYYNGMYALGVDLLADIPVSVCFPLDLIFTTRKGSSTSNEAVSVIPGLHATHQMGTVPLISIETIGSNAPLLKCLRNHYYNSTAHLTSPLLNRSSITGQLVTVIMFNPDFKWRGRGRETFINWIMVNARIEPVEEFGSSTGSQSSPGTGRKSSSGLQAYSFVDSREAAVCDYLPPCPGPDSGPNRMILMVFAQPSGAIDANTIRRSRVPQAFSLRDWHRSLGLGPLIALNCFRVAYEPCVDAIHKRAGLVNATESSTTPADISKYVSIGSITSGPPSMSAPSITSIAEVEAMHSTSLTSSDVIEGPPRLAAETIDITEVQFTKILTSLKRAEDRAEKQARLTIEAQQSRDAALMELANLQKAMSSMAAAPNASSPPDVDVESLKAQLSQLRKQQLETTALLESQRQGEAQRCAELLASHQQRVEALQAQHDAERGSLESTVATLRSALARSSEQLVSAQTQGSQAESLLAERKLLQTQLEEQVTLGQRQAEALRRLESEAISTREQLARQTKSEEFVASLTREMRDLEQANTQLEAMLATKSATILTLETSLASSQERNEKLLRMQGESQQRSLSSLDEIKQLRDTVASRDAQISRLLAEQASHNEVKTLAEAQSKQIAELQLDVNAKASEVKALQTEVRSLEDRCQQHAATIDNLQAQIATLNEDLKHAEVERASLSEQLGSQLETARMSMSLLEQELEQVRLSQTVGELEAPQRPSGDQEETSSVISIEHLMEKLQEDGSNLQATLVELEQQRKQVDQHDGLLNAGSRVKPVEFPAVSPFDELRAMKQAIDNAAADLEAERQLRLDLDVIHEDQLQALTNALQLKTDACIQFEIEIDQYKSQLAAAREVEQSLSKLGQEFEALQHRMESEARVVAEQRDHLQNQLDSLRISYAESEALRVELSRDYEALRETAESTIKRLQRELQRVEAVAAERSLAMKTAASDHQLQRLQWEQASNSHAVDVHVLSEKLQTLQFELEDERLTSERLKKVQQELFAAQNENEHLKQLLRLDTETADPAGQGSGSGSSGSGTAAET